jgi:sulfur carrier protein
MTVNGKDFPLASLEPKTLSGLIQFFKLNPSVVAVERNGSIEDRENWGQIQINPEDKIEIIKFVGGG